MSEKKHKGGYELLKEKYAALQAEKEILVQNAQNNYLSMEKERDEWKAECEHYTNECEFFTDLYKKECDNGTDKDLRIAFLLAHCPFWVRWLYCKQFKKKG